MTRSVRLACLAASIGVAGGVVVSAPAAWAGGNSGSATGVFLPFNGPFPGTVPQNCPAQAATDDFGLQFVSGNANKSGETIEGIAYLVDVTTSQNLYLGHATVWGNAKAFTATYHGVNDAGQTIDFHITSNPHGLQVANMHCS